MAGKKTSSMPSKKSEEGSVSPGGSGGGVNMGFDFGKLFEMAKIPMIALVVIGIVSFFAGLLSLLLLMLLHY
ncbi:hypothetical protein HYT84_04905 [Candidatus Micrarchaeota archaeon]|nr:hypothetical protein [Candidatus Micrarchaeota archaeon]